MYKKYIEEINNRSRLRYIRGLIVRWLLNLKYGYIRHLARRKGATIGEGTVIPLQLAKKANNNLIVDSHTVIQSADIDLRSPVQIGQYTIIGKGVKILTTSHDLSSAEWETKHYGLTVGDYVWLATNSFILPSCTKIGYGAVVGAGGVLAKDLKDMDVAVGNPAKIIKKRECVHFDLVVESLVGGDYLMYVKTGDGEYND